MTAPLLQIRNLHVSVEDTQILKGVDLTVDRGEVHALMGPNGSGKSTLASVLMGHPDYEVTEGEILLNGEDIADLDPTARAVAGMFLAFQYPEEIPGVSAASGSATKCSRWRSSSRSSRSWTRPIRCPTSMRSRPWQGA